MPETARGWLTWSLYVLESQARPFSTPLERTSGTDPRLRDSRETALSVVMILERITQGNGAAKLLAEYYGGDMSWWSFTESEQEVIRRTTKRFVKELRRCGFMPGGAADSP